LILEVKGAANLSRHFNLPLDAPSGNQSGIESSKNIFERQRHQHPIPIVFRSEQIRQRLAQFAERNFYAATRKLRENLFERNGKGEVPDIGLSQTRLQLKRQTIDDFLE
jgi:hypothetical protein